MLTAKQIAKRLEEPRNLIGEARQAFEELRDEMQEQFDEKSEKWQEGEKGELWQSAIDYLEEQISNLEEAEGGEIEV